MMNDAQKSMQEWLTRNNLVVRICDGAITFCATALKAIKQFCYGCSGENRAEVKRCSSADCPLKPFRTGRNPFLKKREMTPEQKEQARQRLLKARGDQK